MRTRRIQPIKAKPTYAFMIEGKCEFWYLQMLMRNERSLDIVIEPKIPQRKALSDQFELVKAMSIEYKHVYWMLDFDVILYETQKARKKEKTALQYFADYKAVIASIPNVTLIVNNPCFEYWFLLHFGFMKKYEFACSNIEKLLRKHLAGYEKTQGFYTTENRDIYLRLKPLLKTAIANAGKAGRFQITTPYVGMSEMNLFFEAKGFNGYFSGNKKVSK